MERKRYDTKMVYIDREKLKAEGIKAYKELQEAARLLRNGELVAFPTETVYGLGADGLNADASYKIYEAKERPSDNPLILHIADFEELQFLVREIPTEAMLLAKKFWPGPLTMIFYKSDSVPLSITGGLDTVAVRMPSDEIARALIRESKTAIAAPSANRSGRPSPTKASHVYEDMNGKIPMIIDAGAVGIGLESTIVDLTAKPVRVLRPGAVTANMLCEVLNEVVSEELPEVSQMQAPKAPGMKYRHYAPKAQLKVVESEDVVEKILKLTEEERQSGRKTGIIATKENARRYRMYQGINDAVVIKVIGEQTDEQSIAKNLFAILREFDESDVQIIYSESFDGEGIRKAIMNRLLKAAGNHVIR